MFFKPLVLCHVSLALMVLPVKAGDTAVYKTSTDVTSTQLQAQAYLNQIGSLNPSKYWPSIKPSLFLHNLKNNINNQLSPYPGSGTNFCAYGALTYLFLQDNPLGYAQLLIQLYQNGEATFGRSHFTPSDAIRQEAGRLKYKGVLDINPAEQMWYLTLADHYKGYLNIFNLHYDAGDENLFWASANFAKFNRMARKLLNYKTAARGADLMRPRIADLHQYLSHKLTQGKVVLFINNRIVHKKDHITIKLAVPTHFVVLEKIGMQNEQITLTYWDYGRITQMQLSAAFLKRIVFGIASFTKPPANAK